MYKIPRQYWERELGQRFVINLRNLRYERKGRGQKSRKIILCTLPYEFMNSLSRDVPEEFC